MQVYQLTEEQKNILENETWDGVTFFAPKLDADGAWVLSQEEVNGCTLVQAISIGCDSWLTSLPKIEYNPIIEN